MKIKVIKIGEKAKKLRAQEWAGKCSRCDSEFEMDHEEMFKHRRSDLYDNDGTEISVMPCIFCDASVFFKVKL